MSQMAPDDEIGHVAQSSGGIVEEQAAFLCCQELEECAWLGKVVIGGAGKGVACRRAIHREGGLFVCRLFFPFPETVGLIGNGAAFVVIKPHEPVLMKTVEGAARSVDGEHVVIDTQSVALGISIGKESALQHFVGRKADTRHDVGRRECGLFYLGKVIFRVAVELHDTYLNERVLSVWPYFGEVEGIERELFGLSLSHDLHAECPPGEIPGLNSREEVMPGAVGVFAVDGGRFGIAQAAYALLTDEVELTPHSLVCCIDKGIGVTAEAVHVAEITRNTSIAHGDGNLMKTLG